MVREGVREALKEECSPPLEVEEGVGGNEGRMLVPLSSINAWLRCEWERERDAGREGGREKARVEENYDVTTPRKGWAWTEEGRKGGKISVWREGEGEDEEEVAVVEEGEGRRQVGE